MISVGKGSKAGPDRALCFLKRINVRQSGAAFERGGELTMSTIKDVAKNLNPFVGLHVHPYAQLFANQAIEFHKLIHLSGRNPDEVKRHLAHWPGSLQSMRYFYAEYDCFPCELNEGLS